MQHSCHVLGYHVGDWRELDFAERDRATGGITMSAAHPASRSATTGLVEGAHLDQSEFHRRYEATSPGFKAELIHGVVYMPSPVGDEHGITQGHAILWLGCYAAETPGVQACGEVTIILGHRSEPQPDAVLRIVSECGGQTSNEGGFIRGAPELVFEVAKATRYVDLGPKLADCEQAGVREYLVRAFEPDEILWFRHEQGALRQQDPDADGVYRSVVFPGLWLDPDAMLSGDAKQLRRGVDRGASSPEHAKFVAELTRKRTAPP